MQELQEAPVDPWVKEIPWKGNGNSLQYSRLENSMDRGAWQSIVRRVAKSLKQLVMHACTLLVRAGAPPGCQGCGG